MKKFNIAIAIIALVALCSCSGQSNTDMLAQKESSSLSLTLVWNANSLQHNFKFADYNATLGELYFGQDFEQDMNDMEDIISIELGLVRSSVNGTQTMGFAHFDDETIDVE